MNCRALLLGCLLAAPAALEAQRPRPFAITDNSLLVEEAFNQEAGVFQNVLLFSRPRGGGSWVMEFTQEWPLGSQLHQLSFTMPLALDGLVMGKMLVNYRLQALTEDADGPAFSPRVSLGLPTGPDDGYRWGLHINLPASRQFGDWYLHANAGVAWETWRAGLSGVAGQGSERLLSPQLAGSVIYRALPMVHLLVESVARFEEVQALGCCGTEYETGVIISPGFRAAYNLGDHQVVLGAGVPIGLVGERATSLLLYFSYELPFKR